MNKNQWARFWYGSGNKWDIYGENREPTDKELFDCLEHLTPCDKHDIWYDNDAYWGCPMCGEKE